MISDTSGVFINFLGLDPAPKCDWANPVGGLALTLISMVGIPAGRAGEQMGGKVSVIFSPYMAWHECDP
jgi:hypothetical protein